MYVPPSFRISDPDKLAAFMNEHSFATLVSNHSDAPFASHLPVLFHQEGGVHGTLVSHMARANPQWQHFESSQEILAIFHGPHSYVSPSWYQTKLSVPTWNYAAVHAYGIPKILDNHDRVVALLDETVSFYEKDFDRPWPAILPDEFRDKLIDSIVAFEIPISRIEGKFKLSQNRNEEDIQGVFDSLSQSSDSRSRELAELMRHECLDNDTPPLNGR